MIRKLFPKRHKKKSGLPPGSLVYVGEERAEKIRMTLLDYDSTQYDEKEIATIEDVFDYRDRQTITWININGLQDIQTIQKMGTHFGFHLLALEDILNTGQRPKLEIFENYILIILKMITFDKKTNEVHDEQVSLLIGDNYVISLQEHQGDVFENVRNRIRKNKGQIRSNGADYLGYALLDAIVDNYFIVLEQLGEKIEGMEDEVMADPDQSSLNKLYHLKHDLLYLKKAVWPLREVTNSLVKGGLSLIKEATTIYLRDVYDHTIQIIDMVETMRDVNAGLYDMYLSGVSNRTNEVMKVLTIIATIFIPLTFIAGIYGMNFEYMPELKWPWGYFGVLGIMGLVAIFIDCFR